MGEHCGNLLGSTRFFICLDTVKLINPVSRRETLMRKWIMYFSLYLAGFCIPWFLDAMLSGVTTAVFAYGSIIAVSAVCFWLSVRKPNKGFDHE